MKRGMSDEGWDGLKDSWREGLMERGRACGKGWWWGIRLIGVFSAPFTGVLNTIACVCRRGVSGVFPAGLRLAFVSSVRDSLGDGSVSPFFTGG